MTAACWILTLQLTFADLHGGTVPQHGGRRVQGLGAAAAHWQALRGGQSQPQGPEDPSEVPVRVSLASCSGEEAFS